MKKIRNVKFLFFVLATLVFILSCGNTSKGDKAEKKDEIVFANFRDIRDLNPHNYAGEMYAQNMIYEGLVKIDNQGKIIPSLAESWEISPDGKEYTFHLRKGVVFSDV